ELEPQILTGVLEASRPVDILRVMDDAEADVFCPHWASIEPETAQELHHAGKLISVWTVDDAVSLAWSKALQANATSPNKPRTTRPRGRCPSSAIGRCSDCGSRRRASRSATRPKSTLAR